MRTAAIVLAAVALMGGAHGAAVPRSEDTTTTTDVATATVEEVSATATEDVTATETLIESSTPIPTETETLIETETATETAIATETATEVSLLTERVLGLVDCVRGVGETCKDCISMEGGMFNPNLNATCLMGCVTADENQDALNAVCAPLGIDFPQFASCHDTIKETCGKCMEVESQVFGLHVLDVDDDCFETCYFANAEAIRAACPLPAPLKKAYDCHKQLGETCGDCVDDDHDIDNECLDKCYADNQADLEEVCPEGVMKLFGEVAELHDDEAAVKDLLNNVLNHLGIPAEMLALLPFDLEEFIDDIMGGDIDLQELFQSAMSEDGTPDLQGLLNAIVATQQDDDDDDDFTTTTAVAMETETETETETPTATETDDDDDDDDNTTTAVAMETETATAMELQAAPTETETDDDDDDDDNTTTAVAMQTESEAATTEADDDDDDDDREDGKGHRHGNDGHRHPGHHDDDEEDDDDHMHGNHGHHNDGYYGNDGHMHDGHDDDDDVNDGHRHHGHDHDDDVTKTAEATATA